MREEAGAQTRPFGKAGQSFPILSFGGQRIVDGHGCRVNGAIEIVNAATDRRSAILEQRGSIDPS
jgi:hypothetical protein